LHWRETLNPCGTTLAWQAWQAWLATACDKRHRALVAVLVGDLWHVVIAAGLAACGASPIAACASRLCWLATCGTSLSRLGWRPQHEAGSPHWRRAAPIRAMHFGHVVVAWLATELAFRCWQVNRGW
jgi:hypothetical protein